MSSRSLKITAIWRSDEFVVSDSKTPPPQDEAYFIIDEPSENIVVHIPASFSIISKRIIERRVNSIAKSGFRLPNSDIRIGMNFSVDLSMDETIPEILLQVGHHYSLNSPTEVYVEPSLEARAGHRELEPVYEPERITHTEPTHEPVSELEYVPSFLAHDTPVDQPLTSKPSSRVSSHQPDHGLSADESLAGRFVIALSKLGDTFLSRAGETYTVEYTQGNVEFIAKDGNIQILETKRVSGQDPVLIAAVESAQQ